MLEGSYLALHETLSRSIPAERLISDPLRTLAYGGDASFYRLIPRLVVRVESEGEVVQVIRACRKHKLPLTFRAAGTSLAGQAVTDSVLVQLGRSWTGIRIHENAGRVTLQPGVIGAQANARLLPFQKKIGPDPASINAAMIGGIVANNSSGMCCGTAENSYKTLWGMRLILADGTLLDSGDPDSRASFLRTHAGLASRLLELSARVKGNAALAERVRSKYRLKNTTGYSLNALVDFADPIEILQHLVVGSEGTLGFVAEVTFHTVPEHPHKATSLMLFPHIKSACEAIPFLKQSGVAAAELMDRASLRSVEHKPGMPDYLKTLKPEAAALLVEARAPEEKELREQVEQVRRAIAHLPTVHPIGFTTEAAEYTQLWNIRKGLLTSAGAVRQAGTTVILEDVAVPIHRLAQATLEFQGLLAAHGYDQAIIFGHALEGNLHFVFPQSFHSASEVERFGRFTDDLCRVVVGTYDGSLKAEHGTGRTMAPYVEMEWGEEAYGLMKEIKAAFDPDNLLNPGVILNDDAQIHLKHLKPLPIADPLVDKCIECGFCESGCPSRHLTLTPRQRIAVWREIACLSAGPKTRREAELRKAYSYQGEQTCATDGLCAMACPVDIDTGKLIKQLRSLQRSALSGRVASWAARHMGATTAAMRLGLNALDGAHRLLGTAAMGRLAAIARRAFFNSLPQWNSALPRGADRIRRRAPAPDHPRQVVYFPSCVSRSLGPSRGGSVRDSQIQRTEALLRKAGCEVIYPDGIDGLCCGMAYTSKGYAGQGDEKLRQLEGALMEASKGGRHPVLFDTSPCLFRWREAATPQSGLQVFDPVEFIEDHLMRRLSFHVLPVTVALHITCSARKLGLADRTRRIAALCAETVVVPDQVGCCGFAGDRGFTVPELNASALHELKSLLPAECRSGYSTSRTCEIGMSLHGGIPYQSIVYLVDQATEPRNSESRS